MNNLSLADAAIETCIGNGTFLLHITSNLYRIERFSMHIVSAGATMKSVVPPGYKQTEVGVIPEDWDVKRIGDLASVGAGGTPSRKIPEYWNGSIPWITTSQIDFGMIAEADQFITEDGLYNSATKLLPAGTLLMALYGQGKTRGKVGVLGFEATTNQACAAISIHGDVSREFLLHFLISRYEVIRNSSNSGSQENLNGQIVKDIPVVLPPTEDEQEAIAEALSNTDALIESLEQLISKKRHLKQGAMQELLTGKKRLPGFQVKPGYKHAEVGTIPEDWDVRLLQTLAEKIMVGIASAATYAYRDHGIVLFRNQNIKPNFLDDSDVLYVTPEYEATFKNKRLMPGDLLTARTGYPGTTCIVPDRYESTQSFTTLITRPKSNAVDSKFLCFYINSEQGQAFFEQNQIGGGQKNVNAGSLKQLPVPLPPTKAEQEAIATILSNMDTEITGLETKLAKTRQLKQGMMHNLLTGRIRLV